MNIPQKLQMFFDMAERLRNKESELNWKKDKLIHAKGELDQESIDELETEINDLKQRYIPSHLITYSEDFKRFFSDEYITEFNKEFRKDYTRAQYGLQGIMEENDYESYGYWKETSNYYKNNSSYYFRKAVEFSKNLEAIYEWRGIRDDLSH